MRDPDGVRGDKWLTTYDDAMRFWSKMRLHQIVLTRDEIIARRYMAVRLADGESDGTVYETRDAAMRHQPGDQNRFLYFQIPFERLSNHACDTLLWYARRRYDAGFRPAGAHEGAVLILPTRNEDLFR